MDECLPSEELLELLVRSQEDLCNSQLHILD
jgi:hypothetical protein